jgi:hypothetical protein
MTISLGTRDRTRNVRCSISTGDSCHCYRDLMMADGDANWWPRPAGSFTSAKRIGKYSTCQAAREPPHRVH